MWDEEMIISYLKNNLSESRFIHSIGVRDTAEKLALQYNEKLANKARMAGIVHDCAKDLSNEKLMGIAIDEGYIVDEVCKRQPQLLHGLVGSIIAKKIMHIEDQDILNSIKYHTTGKKDMTTLEKIIYISDYIEPSRDFNGVEDLRQLAFRNLDEGVLKAFDNTINYVISNGQLLHEQTIAARNFIILRKMRMALNG